MNGHAKYKPEIAITDNGFAIITAKGVDAVSFAEVRVIVVYKLDELTADLVCGDIVKCAGDGKQIRTIYEALLGFDAIMKAFEALPGFDRRWRNAEVLPPFATTRTAI